MGRVFPSYFVHIFAYIPAFTVKPGSPDSPPGGFLYPLAGDSSLPIFIEGHRTITALRSCSGPTSLCGVEELPRGGRVIPAHIGSPMVYGFQLPSGEVVLGEYNLVAEAVRSSFDAHGLFPFTQSSFANFLGDPELYERALRRCCELCEISRPGAGVTFRANHPFSPIFK